MLVEGYLRSYNGYVSVTVRNGLVEMFGRKEVKESSKISKSDSASKVVIQGESKEELPI